MEGNLETRDAWCGGTAHAQGHPLIDTSSSFLLRTPIYRVSWNLAARKRLRISCLIGYLWPEGILVFQFRTESLSYYDRQEKPPPTDGSTGRSFSLPLVHNRIGDASWSL